MAWLLEQGATRISESRSVRILKKSTAIPRVFQFYTRIILGGVLPYCLLASTFFASVSPHSMRSACHNSSIWVHICYSIWAELKNRSAAPFISIILGNCECFCFSTAVHFHSSRGTIEQETCLPHHGHTICLRIIYQCKKPLVFNN
jgi:hypothetical protein